jgi:hypothetical protein
LEWRYAIALAVSNAHLTLGNEKRKKFECERKQFKKKNKETVCAKKLL